MNLVVRTNPAGGGISTFCRVGFVIETLSLKAPEERIKESWLK
jgi:hypothetical protein